MNEIFISYSHRDSSFVDRLIREIEQKGLDTWMDREDIGGGAAWRAAISQAIRECEVFIVVLSPQSLASRNVTKELSLADKHNKPKIPIRYQPCEIPPEVEYQLAGLQWVDFTEQSFEEALDQLIRALRPEKGEARRPRPPQPESPRPADMTPPALPQLLPGTWQVQFGYQHTGVMGQITLEMHPNGLFRGQVQSPTGTSSIEGQWQITPSNQLVLQGQQTAGFQVAPYTAMIQFTQIAPDLLMGVSGTGEQVVWQRIN